MVKFSYPGLPATNVTACWCMPRQLDQRRTCSLCSLVEDGRCPSFSGVNPSQERPGPGINLKHDGRCPSFSGVNPGQDIERPGPRTDLKHDGRCLFFSGVNGPELT